MGVNPEKCKKGYSIMNENKSLISTREKEKGKKLYSVPKIEEIANIRKVTKGSTLNTNDAGGQGGDNTNPPSDPGS
jgi:hypothetical protein